MQRVAVTILIFVFSTLLPAILCIPINQAQVFGTHNSYHISPYPKATVPAWNYTNYNLTTQLGCLGIRRLELDFWYTNKTWLVYHINTYDQRTVCPNLFACLTEINTWSLANPTHFPIIVDLEPNDFNGLTASQWTDFEALLQSIFGSNTGSRLITPDFVRGGASTLLAGVQAYGWPDVNAVRGKLLLYLDSQWDNYTLGTYNNLQQRSCFIDCKNSVNTTNTNCVLFSFDTLNTTSNLQALNQQAMAGFITRARADADYYPGNITDADTENDSFFVLDTDGNGEISSTEVANFVTLSTGETFTESELDLLNTGTALCAPMDITEYENCFLPLASGYIASFLTPTPTDQQAIAGRNAALSSGATDVDTDYPVPNPGYFVDFFHAPGNAMPVRCNPLLAPPNCTSAQLETGLFNPSCPASLKADPIDQYPTGGASSQIITDGVNVDGNGPSSASQLFNFLKFVF